MVVAVEETMEEVEVETMAGDNSVKLLGVGMSLFNLMFDLIY
jgi:hypothetical protein